MARTGSPGGGMNAAVNAAVAAQSTPGGFVANISQASAANVEAAYTTNFVQNDPQSFFGSPNFLSDIPRYRPGSRGDQFFDAAMIAGTVDGELTDADAARIGVDTMDIAPRWYNSVDQDSPMYQARQTVNTTTGNFVIEPGISSGLTDIPTSTTNYARPRTVAAGWAPTKDANEVVINHEQGTLTVVFRDGTVYNYYDVPRSVWIKFHLSISKGKSFLNHANSVNRMEGTLLAYNHGPADMSDVSEEIRQAVYLAARTKQIYHRNGATEPKHYQTVQKFADKANRGQKVLRTVNGRAVVRARVETVGYRQPTQNAPASKPTPRNTSAQKKK